MGKFYHSAKGERILNLSRQKTIHYHCILNWCIYDLNPSFINAFMTDHRHAVRFGVALDLLGRPLFLPNFVRNVSLHL